MQTSFSFCPESEPVSQTPKQSVLSHAGRRLLDRRGFLQQTGSGLSAIALAHLLGQAGSLGAENSARLRTGPRSMRTRSRRRSPLPASARNVLVLFCSGACSQIDTWDYKPELIRRHDQPLPGRMNLVTFQGENGNVIKSPYRFRPRGESGKSPPTSCRIWGHRR